MIRSYTELSQISDYEARYRYLKLRCRVGDETFGFDRIFNQMFYRSGEWQRVRRDIIVRDCGCDMGVVGHEIGGRIVIHHMNPIDINDIRNSTEYLLNPEYLICVSENTHKAIHYGDESLIDHQLIERRPNDTCPWKRA